MSATGRPAGGKGTAEAAELRKAKADRPESKARRGLTRQEGKGGNCGRTAEELRKQTVPSLPSLSRPFALVRGEPSGTRERFPAAPPFGAGGSRVLCVAETGAQVLTHPAFDRPAVVNPRRRGPMGAITLDRVRRRRKREALQAEAEKLRSAAPHDTLRDMLNAASVNGAGERAQSPADEAGVIVEALGLLDARLRRPGQVFGSPESVRAFLALHMAALEREEFCVMFLDNQHSLIAFETLGVGTLTRTDVAPREVARRAMLLNAAAVILAHNHPSGNPTPSHADKVLTAHLRDALRWVEVRVLDHLIVGRLHVASMAELGMM